MTAAQLALDDCDPDWTDDALVLLHGLIPPQYFDLRGQGPTPWQIHTMTTIDVKGAYL